MRTCAVVCPFFTSTILPLRMLRALSFTETSCRLRCVGISVEPRNVLASLLGSFEQLVEFRRAQIDLIKPAIEVVSDFAHIAGKSTGKQQPGQPLHPYQP